MDASRERRFRDLPGRKGMVRALAVAPMRLRDDIVGVLATAGMDPFPPVGSRLTALQILASIAAVTIENNRLLQQERRRTRQAELLLELASLQAEELLPFLQRVADAINPALGVEDTELVLQDENGLRVVFSATPEPRRRDASDGTGHRMPDPDLSWAAGIIPPASRCSPTISQLIRRSARYFAGSGIRSLLAVPIPVRGRAQRRPAGSRDAVRQVLGR